MPVLLKIRFWARKKLLSAHDQWLVSADNVRSPTKALFYFFSGWGMAWWVTLLHGVWVPGLTERKTNLLHFGYNQLYAEVHYIRHLQAYLNSVVCNWEQILISNVFSLNLIQLIEDQCQWICDSALQWSTFKVRH